MDRLVQLLMAPFVIAVAALWAVVGLFFAFPLVVKAIVIFTMDLLISALTQQRRSRAAEGLRHALLFYPRGFAIIISALNLSSNPPTEEEKAYEFARGRFGPLVDSGKMIVLALVFWGTSAMFFHHLGVMRIERIAEMEQGMASLVGLGPTRVAAAQPQAEAAPETTPAPQAETPPPQAAPQTQASARRFESDCTINTPRTNLRAAARRASPSQARLPNGTPVMTGDDPIGGDDWIRVATEDGRVGYVKRELLTCEREPR